MTVSREILSSSASAPGGARDIPPLHHHADALRRKRWVLAVAAAIALTAALTIWWYAGLRNQFYPDNFGVVEPGRIYRSAQISRRILRKTLQENHIAVIVDLSRESTPDAVAEKRIAAEMGIPHLNNYRLGGDGVGDPQSYPDAIKAIVEANRAGKAVLVHCQSGAQRTGGVIATYRILVQRKPKSEAFAETQRYHHRPHGNPLLFRFVEDHLSQWKLQLQADHVIPVD
ncbi:MAG TPA: tyrosine-protein phosphatase [Tepidisphaeraceae bacterium]|jgi:protein tyrosine/serine phosphatase|nr:tyrosine-protein phosphatase [Tepidisphaeraceae bacterium]